MFDFPFDRPSVVTALFALFSYLFLYRKGADLFLKSKDIDLNGRFAFGTIFLFYVLISVHCINGDFFHLMDSVHNYDLTDPEQNSQEPVYTLIAKIWNRNYLLFRLTVWGIAVLCIQKIYQSIGANFHLGFWMFLVCYAILFAYARASSAMAIYFLGLVLLISDLRSYFVRLLGIGLLFLSYEFHHSMLILILLTPLAFFPLNKFTFFTVLGALPFIVIIVRIVFSSVLDDASILDDEALQRKMDNYSVREGRTDTLRTQIMDGIKYVSAYIPFIVSAFYVVVRGVMDFLKKAEKRLFIYTFWLFIVTTAVSYLDMEVNTFFYRMLYMTLIPSIVIFTVLVQNRIISKKIQCRVLYIAMTSQILNYLYMLYLNILNKS